MAEPSSTTKQHAQKTPGPSASAGKHAPVSVDGTEVSANAPQEGLVARHAALVGDPRLGSATGGQRLRLVQRLQRGYGNAYVARLVQRAVVEAPTAAPVAPQQDPKFIAVEQKIGQTAKQEKQHPPAKAKAAEAQAAAQGPPNDVASQAAEKQVDKMDQQKPGEFDKKAFIAAVKKAIEASAPKNLEEADDLKKSGKAGQVKGEVSGIVSKGKQDSEGSIKKANTESPDTSGAKPKVVTPMGDEKPGAAPGDPGAAKAIPSPKTAAETSMAAGPAQVNQEMNQAGVTEEQLKNSNEPQFTDAAAAKAGAEEHSKTAPVEYKAAENQTLDKAGADAKGAAATDLQGMHAQKTGALGSVTGQKGGAKSKDEAKRAEVSSKIETIFNQTKTEVTAILDGLDAKVNTAFESGEKAAREQFETYVEQKMSKYKRDRYLGIFGPELWLKDKLMDMPSEVNAFYQQGRDLYLSKMEGVISNVADVVGGELGKAKARIALGKQQVKEFVASQPKELQQVAKDAEQQIGSKFDELEGEVNSKQEGLVQTLADKYVAARGELDSRIDALKEENKGLVNKAKDAIGGVIKTITQLKDMLLGVLAKASNVIGDIIKDPIKFLGNLVSAIKMGLNQFGANITKHLKAALMGWLFGTLGEAGIQLPDSFDLKGILSLILQVLGLTYANVRSIAVKIAGEKVVAFVEGTVTFFTTLAKEGPAGLWQWIKDKIAELNIKEMVLGAIKDFVITKIITAGITWLISMLNPAAAFIKACKMIYDVVMFIVERGAQIMEFVNSVLDGLGAIVAGSLGSAANLVENSLAKVLPLAIAFLASLLGVGGIAEKIKEIIEKIRAPITKLITAVVGPILKPLKALYAKGAKVVKGLAEKGKAALKKGVDKVKGKFGGAKGQDGKPEDRERDAMKQVHSLLTNGRTSAPDLRKALPKIKSTFGLASLTLTEGSVSGGKEAVTVESRVARTMESGSVPAGGKDLDPLIYRALVSLAPEMYAGLPAPAPPTTEKPEPGKRVPTREEQQQAQAALQAQGRGRIETLGGKIQKALGNVQVDYGQAAHARVRAPLPKPTIITAPNLFSALGGKFFVDQQNNNYIVPASEAAKGIKVDPSTLLIGTDPAVSSKYSYADAKNAINAIQMKGILLAIAEEPGGIMPRGRQLTMFLAAMVAEPSRYSVAQVTNLLALGDPAAAGKDMVGSAGKLSMAQGGSDPKPGANVETDPRLAGVNPGKDMPRKVTDKDLAIVKGRKDLMDQIEKLNVPGASDEALVKGIAAILRGAIKDLETAHKSGGG